MAMVEEYILEKEPHMATLDDIEKLATTYADRRVAMGSAVKKLDDEMSAARNRHLRPIVNAAGKAGEAKAALEAAIEESPDLFKRPKTLILSGIKCGFKKQPGKVVIENPDRVMSLIRRHFPERVDDLIKTKEEPLKNAISNLTVAEAKRIGVTIEDDDDVVVVSATNSDIDKLVAAFLKDAEQ